MYDKIFISVMKTKKNNKNMYLMTNAMALMKILLLVYIPLIKFTLTKIKYLY